MKKITVLETRVISSGEKEGKKWELFGVKANDEEGKPIGVKLKTFATLPIGVAIDVDVEAQHNEQYGTSYLLKLPKMQAGAAAAAIAELRGRVERLESELTRIAAVVDRRDLVATAPVGPPAPTGPAYAAIPDEDIPF